jgi:hypothetical protein
MRELSYLDDVANNAVQKKSPTHHSGFGLYSDSGPSYVQTWDGSHAMYNLDQNKFLAGTPQGIFGMSTNSFPTLDLSYLEQFNTLDADNTFAMLF